MKKLLVIVLVLLLLMVAISATVAFLERKGFVSSEKIAVVRIEGPIIESRHLVAEIREYVEDDSVKAIVLRVDSPGGAVAPSQEIYQEVRKAVRAKNVVASMGSVAASGGYYVLAPSTKIVANPGTLTGSIGVIMEIPNIEGLMGKIGVKTTVIKSGKFKDMASSMKELTPAERRILQNLMDDVHAQFIEAVAEGRGMPVEKVTRLADGRIFSGRQAKEEGLVDELGGLEDAIDLSAKLAGIEGEPEVVYRKRRETLLEMLMGGVSGKVDDLFPSVKIKYLLSP